VRIQISWSVVVVGVMTCALGVTPARAQLNTQHIKGTVALKAGSPPPPHSYVLPLLYVYKTDTSMMRRATRSAWAPI
jgi:hypothetical protein